MDIIRYNKPSLPLSWEYDLSVKDVKQYIYKWKTLSQEIAEELYIAHRMLSKTGVKSNDPRWDKRPTLETWSSYCEDIGSSKRVVNRWLKQWFENPLEKIIEQSAIKKRLTDYGDNIYFVSGDYSENRFDDRIFHEDEKWNTLTTLSRFFHPDKTEYSLREYARVQEFPDDFIFVGNYSTIKKQIGNAVSPTMGKYITKNLKGKTCGDLFAGCGGFTLGAEMNGIKSLWMVEWDKPATTTYSVNFPDTEIINDNIRHLDPNDFKKVDIIIGGPPCQGFSNAGLQFKDDPRNELYKEFLRFVEMINPEEFIMENVPEIQNIKDQIISDFEDIGFSVTTELVKGENIEMRQIRKRFFFKGKKI